MSVFATWDRENGYRSWVDSSTKPLATGIPLPKNPAASSRYFQPADKPAAEPAAVPVTEPAAAPAATTRRVSFTDDMTQTPQVA